MNMGGADRTAGPTTIGESVPGPSWRETTVALALGAAALAPTLTFLMGLDQGVFAFMGSELLEGHWPYLSTWDQAWPGLVVLQATEIRTLGRSAEAFRAFDLVWQLATVLCIHRITYRVAGGAGALLAVIVYALTYQSYGAWNTAQREGFGTLFALVGLLLAWRFGARHPIAAASAVGLGLGLAVTIKPTLLALAALYLPLVPMAWRAPGNTAKALAAACAGILAPTLAFVAIYAGMDGLRELYEATVAYQLQVYVGHADAGVAVLTRWVERTLRLGASTKLLVVGYLPFLFFGPARRKRAMLYAGLLGSVFAVWIQGTFAGYHYLPGLALGSVLVGSAYAQLANRMVQNRELALGPLRASVSALGALALGAAAVPLYLNTGAVESLATLSFLAPPAHDAFTNGTVFSYGEDWYAARYLAEHTTPEDRIQVWGHESLVYYLAERSPSSRFQTSNPLVMRPEGGRITSMQTRWRAEFLADVRRHPPAYVVVLTEDHWWWAPGKKTSKQLLDEFPRWRDYIAHHYVPETKIGRLEILRRASERPSPQSVLP